MVQENLSNRELSGCKGLYVREGERDLREETVNCSPAWDCGRGSLL